MSIDYTKPAIKKKNCVVHLPVKGDIGLWRRNSCRPYFLFWTCMSEIKNWEFLPRLSRLIDKMRNTKIKETICSSVYIIWSYVY